MQFAETGLSVLGEGQQPTAVWLPTIRLALSVHCWNGLAVFPPRKFFPNVVSVVLSKIERPACDTDVFIAIVGPGIQDSTEDKNFCRINRSLDSVWQPLS